MTKYSIFCTFTKITILALGKKERDIQLLKIMKLKELMNMQ